MNYLLQINNFAWCKLYTYFTSILYIFYKYKYMDFFNYCLFSLLYRTVESWGGGGGGGGSWVPMSTTGPNMSCVPYTPLLQQYAFLHVCIASRIDSA